MKFLPLILFSFLFLCLSKKNTQSPKSLSSIKEELFPQPIIPDTQSEIEMVII